MKPKGRLRFALVHCGVQYQPQHGQELTLKSLASNWVLQVKSLVNFYEVANEQKHNDNGISTCLALGGCYSTYLFLYLRESCDKLKSWEYLHFRKSSINISIACQTCIDPVYLLKLLPYIYS